jgi:hypothetical protein
LSVATAALKVPALTVTLSAASCPGPVIENGDPPAVVAFGLAFVLLPFEFFEYAIPPKFGIVIS